MCGISGIISKNPDDISIERLKKMTDAIAHRGPDGEGHWKSENRNVCLGHRRLSIIDLSHEADQPMHFLDRYTIVFNGEIYNYIELKDILIKKGYIFKTSSDTEVLMALYDNKKENCLNDLDGMFAFAIYDKVACKVFCARDRFGEKPFYYSYKKGEYFIFGSEMKALWASGVDKKINGRMMFNYIEFGHFKNPNDMSETFYENCTLLPHSHYINIDVASIDLKINKYYELEYRNINNNITVDIAKKQFAELFYTSVSRRLRSDVPVGSSLSGGLDSSLVVCMINKIKGSFQKQTTFSAIFPGFSKDESKYMQYVIDATNVEPHFTKPNENEFYDVVDKIMYHQEEPFGSTSIYAQYKVMELAKINNVAVLLDGQGADEILAGYHGYYSIFFQELYKISKRKYHKAINDYYRLQASNSINAIIAKHHKGWKQKIRESNPSLFNLIKKVNRQFAYESVFESDFYNQYFKEEFKHIGEDYKSLNEALHCSTMGGSLQNLLRYADRNSMMNSREVRLPFLSHQLVEFLFTLPSNMKVNDGWTKWIMRETFNDLMPKEITWRKDKIGYEPPNAVAVNHKMLKEAIEKIIQNHIPVKNSEKSMLRGWDIYMASKLL